MSEDRYEEVERLCEELQPYIDADGAESGEYWSLLVQMSSYMCCMGEGFDDHYIEELRNAIEDGKEFVELEEDVEIPLPCDPCSFRATWMRELGIDDESIAASIEREPPTTIKAELRKIKKANIE